MSGKRHVIRDNAIGVDKQGQQTGVCGRGIFLGRPHGLGHVVHRRALNPLVQVLDFIDLGQLAHQIKVEVLDRLAHLRALPGCGRKKCDLEPDVGIAGEGEIVFRELLELERARRALGS